MAMSLPSRMLCALYTMPVLPARQHRSELEVREGLPGQRAAVVSPDLEGGGRLLCIDQDLDIGDGRAWDEQLQTGVAGLDLLPVSQRVLLDLLASDEGPADALCVGQQELIPIASEFAVEPIHRHVLEPGVGVLAPADRERGSIDQMDDSTLLGAGDHLQISIHGGTPFGTCCRSRARRGRPPGLDRLAPTPTKNLGEITTAHEANEVRAGSRTWYSRPMTSWARSFERPHRIEPRVFDPAQPAFSHLGGWRVKRGRRLVFPAPCPAPHPTRSHAGRRDTERAGLCDRASKG